MEDFEFSIIPVNSIIELEKLNLFTCGEKEEELAINDFLKNDSKDYDLKGATKSFLYFKDKELIGFFSLCTSQTEVTKKFKKRRRIFTFSKPLTTYPSIELVYFAINKNKQGERLGTSMMYYILKMLYYNVYQHVGFMLVTVKSRSETTGFYEKMGFTYHKTKSGNDNLMAITTTEIETLLGMDEDFKSE